jgi:hypothetical protein
LYANTRDATAWLAIVVLRLDAAGHRMRRAGERLAPGDAKVVVANGVHTVAAAGTVLLGRDARRLRESDESRDDDDETTRGAAVPQQVPPASRDDAGGVPRKKEGV